MLTEELGYLDLETNSPPRNTSLHGVRVDYVLCSPALTPRIRKEETRLHLKEVGSDHKALVANIRFNRNKLLVGIKGKRLKEAEKLEIRTVMNALGRKAVNFAHDLTSAHRKLVDDDTVIVEGPGVERALQSCDLCFEFTDSQKRSSPNGDNNKIPVTNIETMMAFVEQYLA